MTEATARRLDLRRIRVGWPRPPRRRFHLTPTERAVVQVFRGSHRPRTQAEVSRRIGVDPSAVHCLIHKMLQLGYLVERDAA